MNDINKLDSRILTVLSKIPMNPSELSKYLSVNRTTINYRLRKLHSSGSVKKFSVGRKSMYERTFNRSGSKAHFQVHKSNNIINAYKELLSIPRGTLIFSMQGSGSVTGQFKNIPAGLIALVQKSFKRKGIIMRGISNAESLKSLAMLEESSLRSHVGRKHGFKVVTGHNFLGNGEIFSTKNLLILSNPKTKNAVVVKEKGITEIVHEISTLLCASIDNVPAFDLNTYIKPPASKPKPPPES